MVARGVEGAEQRLGRRLPHPVELVENHQRVVAGLAGHGAELPQRVDEAPRPRVRIGSGDADNRRWLLGTGQRDAVEAAAESRGQRPGESGPAGPGGPAETQDPGRGGGGAFRASVGGGLTCHQVIERLVLLLGAADVFPVERLPHPRRRDRPLRRPPPRQLLHHLGPRLRGDRRGVRRMEAHDTVALPGERIPHRVGQRVVPRRAQDPGNREVEPVRLEPRRLAGVGDDGDRGGAADVAGLHPAARHELADGAEPAVSPRTPGSHVWSRTTARTAASVTSTSPAVSGPDGCATGAADAGVMAAFPPSSLRVQKPVLSPLASSCSAQRVRRAMSTFSSSVYPGASMTSSRS